METGENINNVILNKKVISEESLARARQIHQTLSRLDNCSINSFTIKDIFEDYFCMLYPELLKTAQHTGRLIVNTEAGLVRKIFTYEDIDLGKLSKIIEEIKNSGNVYEFINMLDLSSYVYLAPLDNNSLNYNFITGQNIDKLKVAFVDYVRYFFKILDNYVIANELMEKNLMTISKDSEEFLFKQNQIVSLRSNVVSAYSSFFGISGGIKKIIHYSKLPEGFPYLITQKEISQMQQLKKYCIQDKYYKDIKIENIFDIMFNIYVELKKAPRVIISTAPDDLDISKEQKADLESRLADAKIDFYERVVRPFVRRTPR